MADTLIHQAQHIDKVIGKQTSEEVRKNIIRVKASISVAKLLSRQGIPFRGHDESLDSSNRGNILKILQHTCDKNEEIASVILENSPKNAKYTSGAIQKEIVHVLAGLVRKKIFEEIGDAKFSIIVDEASDESRKEQMAIVLRFVDGKGLIQERFFAIVHVKDTMSMTLCSAIRDTLSSHNFSLQNLHGQRYDGASNMCGEWKGLQALFLKEFPHAYHVHCMAHRLQLALVVASNVFNANIDFQGAELGTRFDEKVVELLKLSSALDPTDGYKAFDVDAICNLARKHYYIDFSEQEVEALEFQLRHFHLDVCTHPLLKNSSWLADLCHGLAETGKSRHYHLVDKLIRLVLTLPVSTATGERVFSAMTIVKSRLRNSMSDDFLAENLSIYILREKYQIVLV
ncbi:Zinc finger MYM-type protein 1 [Linum grandiflorum]